MEKQVICLGEVLWDCFPGDKKPGGAPMNVALHLRRLGTDSVLISAVGEDPDGKLLRKYLADNGMDVFYLQTNAAFATGTVDVHLDTNQQATYTIVEPVAWDAIGYKTEHTDLLKKANALVFGSLAAREATSRETLFKLLEAAKLKIFDMNLRPPHFSTEILETLLYKADILKINEHELAYLETQYRIADLKETEKLKWLANHFGLQTVCLTLGDKGASVWHNGNLFNHAGFKVKVVDTVGAGDAFLAAFINGLLGGEKMKTILERACGVGAVVASKAGANPEYGLEEVDGLERRPKA